MKLGMYRPLVAASVATLGLLASGSESRPRLEMQPRRALPGPSCSNSSHRKAVRAARRPIGFLKSSTAPSRSPVHGSSC